MLGLDPDAFPLVDHKYACRDVWLVDLAVHKLELEVRMTRLLQQAFGLRPRFLDIAPEARDFFELAHRQRPAGAVTGAVMTASSWSRSCGVRPRNSASYWPPRRPLTAVLLRTKMAL